MSGFWSVFVGVVAIANLLACWWLIRWTARPRPNDAAIGETTGHSWDDGELQELNNPMPRWWLWLFYNSIVFGIAYLLLYPGLGNYPGWLGWTQERQYRGELAAAERRYAPLFAAYAGREVAELARDSEALRIGRRLFINYCAQCHGASGKGGRGFPNLSDDDWLYGGEPEQIKTTLREGRSGMMPALGEALGEDLDAVVSYLLSLGGSVRSPDFAVGQQKFRQMCSVCHGADARGKPALGAPDLSDQIWLYGGTRAAIAETLLRGRNGHMPGFATLLGEDRIHLLAAYVYSLSARD